MARVNITEIRRREIIEAACKIFSEKGYHNTSMADIAAELEVGHGTLYRYYKNKLDIISSVTDLVIERITEVVALEPPEELNTLEDYREQLYRIGKRFFMLHEADPIVHRIFFYDSLSIDKSIAEKVNGAFELFTSYTERYLKTGIKRGFLRPDIHTHEAALAINAMLWEATRRLAEEPELKDESRMVWSETIVGLMLDGLAV
jgi:AcrR family transcriptional regulator